LTLVTPLVIAAIEDELVGRWVDGIDHEEGCVLFPQQRQCASFIQMKIAQASCGPVAGFPKCLPRKDKIFHC